MKKLVKRIFFILTVHQSIPFVFRFFTSNEIARKKRLLFASLILGYAALPVDLINDFFLGIGLVDDLVIVAFLLDVMKKQAPAEWAKKNKINKKEREKKIEIKE